MPDDKILIVEDEEDIRELISFNLKREGYEVIAAINGEAGLDLARLEKPDLMLLDLMLPGIDGLDVCRKIRAGDDTAGLPVIMLTAKGEEADIVAGLELGADDYVTKPFSPRVLLARVKAVLRRNADEGFGAVSNSDIIKTRELLIEFGTRSVTAAGKRVDLTSTEFNLLTFLARRPGWVFTRYQILQGVRGEDSISTDRAVDVQIVGLRRKLGVAGNSIETVRGVGYRFRDDRCRSDEE